ncbi:MAG: GGDEF domain-containing phosphodiesterase [Lachnospiraceae bacterium]|nr:GGDEF domain-containing phosphodiesterase [Lachnospiraceae bacterium]
MRGSIGLDVFDSLVKRNYDWVLELDINTEKVEFLHVNKLMNDNGINSEGVKDYAELKRLLLERFLVEDEREMFAMQIKIPLMVEEIKAKGNFIRTVHIDGGEGVRSEYFRVTAIDDNRYLICLINITMFLDHDWMTDEYSRSGFIAEAEKMMKDPKYAQGYSVVYTNIKGFKAINDFLGTFSGDMIIFMLRDILHKELEPTLIARLESDHFVLITRTELLTSERFERICPQTYVEGSKRLPFSIRFGVYNIKNPNRTIQHMLDRAKLAEKSISDNHSESYAICDDKLSAEYSMRRKLISEVDSALAKGEFKTYYQPVVDAKTGEIVSAEALIRWVHPERGVVSPAQFIPAFEEEGHITKIDSFMVGNVIDFNLARTKAGKKIVPCAVNLSRVDFYDTRLLDETMLRFDERNDMGDLIKFEITESAYAVLEADAYLFLVEMKSMGISLLLDDFGSGMSSLSTLESFAFDVIKLDKGFIDQIGKSEKAEAIIKHTIGLSHDIGAKVVAEGVETEEQLAFLKEADCDMIQGYYFYKPMTQEEFAALI